MGVGRNLSYKKDLFFKHKGFSGHYHIKSGDDDLFINHAATAKNVAVVVDPDSFTSSVPSSKFNEWAEQKQRHITTAPLYKGSTKFRLTYIHAVNYLFWGLFITLLFVKSLLFIALALFLVKVIFQMIIFNGAMKQLKEKDLLPWFLVLEFLLLFIYPVLHITKIFTKPNKWKN